jgi:thiosulfate reductase cytochrome b subunit
MADFAYQPGLAIHTSDVSEAPRHSALVRITHWMFALGFVGLVVSGVGILLAHPHFYWGETGGIGSPSLFDLPLPTMLGGPSGWGRSLHFQSAWLTVLTGLVYGLGGILSGHFRTMIPTQADLSWRRLRSSVLDHLRCKRPAGEEYNVLQRISYVTVIFVLFPMMIVTGLAMSPVITSVVPRIVTVFGGHQSARTIHFFLADTLVLFLLVHIAMVVLAGFASHMREMITGRSVTSRSRS